MGRVNDPPPSRARSRDGRARLLAGAARVLAERGYEGTELRDVAAAGDAPRGSIYHHFPEGKAQLAAAAATARGERIAAMIEDSVGRLGVLEAIQRFLTGFARAAADDPGRLGCPVAALAWADRELPELRDAAASAFASWESPISAALVREGVAAERAPALAGLVVSTVEGALLRARAIGDLGALEQVGAELSALLRPLLAPPEGV